MQSLKQAIQYLFPNAETPRDYELRDDSDGIGQYISRWSRAEPRPAKEALEAADAEAAIGHEETAKIKDAEASIQSILNAAAVAHGYDNILTASSYAALPVGSPFQAESAAFSLWRAQCWQAAYQILAEVKAGARPEPTAEELIAEMPALELPE